MPFLTGLTFDIALSQGEEGEEAPRVRVAPLTPLP
jgi:hypothetical protein